MPPTYTVPANGAVIRALREIRGYTQDDLAHLAGLHARSHVSHIENEVKPPSEPVLRRIADALQVDVSVITARPCLCTRASAEGIVA